MDIIVGALLFLASCVPVFLMTRIGLWLVRKMPNAGFRFALGYAVGGMMTLTFAAWGLGTDGMAWAEAFNGYLLPFLFVMALDIWARRRKGRANLANEVSGTK